MTDNQHSSGTGLHKQFRTEWEAWLDKQLRRILKETGMDKQPEV